MESATLQRHGSAQRPALTPAQMRAIWRQRIRHLPPAARVAFLKTAEAIAALGARNCRQMVQAIVNDRLHIERSACSRTWLDQWEHDGRPFPPPGMKFSREMTRMGLDGRMSRRWTPAPAVDCEDYLDSLSVNRAVFYDHPPSPSAVAIQRIEARGGKEIRR